MAMVSVLVGGLVGGVMWKYLQAERRGEPIVWRSPHAIWLATGGLFVGLVV